MEKIIKKNLNKNIHLSEGNLQSKTTNDSLFLTWSLPSKVTCPFSTNMCRTKCFAKKNETFATVRESRKKNLEETKKETFVSDMIKHLEYHLQRPKAKDKSIFIRIHTSGDFYSLEYFEKWIEIARHFRNNEKISFQAYTKSIQYVWKWIVGDLEEEFITEQKVSDGLDEIDIHLVYSIWNDTDKEDINIATELLSVENQIMQTFTALPKEEIPEAIKQGYFLCEGDCGNCKECYTGDSEKIVIPYH